MPNSPLHERFNINQASSANHIWFNDEKVSNVNGLDSPKSPLLRIESISKGKKSLQKEGFPHKYEFIREIGHGEYGNVYAAQSKTTGQNYAIKKIENVFADLRELKRIIREVKLMKKFRNSPFVMGLHDMYFFPSSQNNNYHLFLVMDLMDEDLHSVLKRGPLPLEKVKSYMFQLLLGLKEMHSKNIIHRDIRPKNLLLKGHRLKIGDFGMGRKLGFRHSVLDITTLRMYRPPEGFFGVNTYAGAVDIWSAGCVFLEMLGKQDIIKTKNDEEQLEKIFNLFGGPSPDLFNNPTVKYANALAQKYDGKQPSPLSKYLDIGDDALDLLSKMLKVNGAERITAAQAVLHPWFSSLWSEIIPKEVEEDQLVALPDKRPDSPDIGDQEEEVMKHELWKEVLIYDDSSLEE
jgi:mitogen-activated protein kinase 7